MMMPHESPNLYYILYYAVLISSVVNSVGIPTIIALLLWKKSTASGVTIPTSKGSMPTVHRTGR